MSAMDLIPPPRQVKVSFALEPAYNALTSLHLLNSKLSGFHQWVERTAAELSPDQLSTNEVACNTAMCYLDSKSWPSFSDWVDALAARDPTAMRDSELDMVLNKAAHVLEKNIADLPDRETLLSDLSTYMELMKHLVEHDEKALDAAYCRTEFGMYQDPVAMQHKLVTHFRAMWDEHLADEWVRNLPILNESIAAFQSLDYSGRSAAEIFALVTDRDVPAKVETVIQDQERITFIPSPHIGPYVLVIDHSQEHTRIMFGARMPQEATIRSPALNRSELVTRLNALADDTRLRILQLVAQEGELRTQEIMTELEISQSAASRHLPQLSATGYLTERRCEGAKCYRLNRDRLEDTFKALQQFLQ